MKESDKFEEPQLNITDDLNDDEPTQESKEKNEIVKTVEPIIATEQEPASVGSEVESSPKSSFGRRIMAFLSTKKGKAFAIILGIIVMLAALFAIPLTRYALAGIVVHKDVTLTVIDQDSKKPVSSAMVMLGTNTGQTDSQGVVKLSSVPVGNYTLTVSKKYYTSSSVSYTVPVLTAPQNAPLSIKATGRNVTVVVTNKVTSKPVADARVTVSDSSAVSNDKGEARIILPVKTEAQKGTVKLNGFNDASFSVQVRATDDQKVSTAITPVGKLFFLSKRTGKIDVMKSNLDGSNAEVVLAGTGQENDASTVLLSTTDWKYLAFYAQRDSDKPKLYLIDATTSKLTTMDEGSADFQLVGWSGHRFIYQVTRSQNIWADKRQALKSFDAETAKLTTLDETQGSGSSFADYASQSIGNVYAVDGTIVYSKSWDISQAVAIGDRKSSIMAVGVDGANKKSLKDFAVGEIAYFDAKLYEPGGVFYRAASRQDNKGSYYEYEDGKLFATADTNDQKFYSAFYATYLQSPSGKKTFWYESRDGKNVLFVGDDKADNAREIGTSEYIPYGWYSDNYLLVSKGGSELYIIDQDSKITDTAKPLKVTDYHKPQLNYPGYGGGYGGQ